MRLIVSNLLLLGVLFTGGCLPSQQPPAKADLRATDTPARVPAIVDAAGTEDEATLPELVHALSDKDPAIRLFAIRSLKERTGRTLGYRYYGTTQQRGEAVRKWYTWLLDQGLVSEPIISGYDALPTNHD
ncbi:MAG: hypothetical protein KTR15_01495 [Phycisphaeraceae bacterium]|nr:hypothetical protein [Phycisphaeraceae bacterium]